MLRKNRKHSGLSLSILIILAFFVAGCGKKAPPKPPIKGKIHTFSQQLIHSFV
jgi:hypothetical protein